MMEAGENVPSDLSHCIWGRGFLSFFFIFYSGVAQYHRLRPQDHMCLSSLLSNPCPSLSPVHPTSLPSPGKVLALCVLQLPPAFISHLLLSEPPDVLVSSSPISLFYPITLLLCSKTSDVSPLLTEGQDTICSHPLPLPPPHPCQTLLWAVLPPCL